MLASTITVTINAVAKVLNFQSTTGNASVYFLAEATRDYTLAIKHTVPKARGLSKESHLARLDVVDYDALGVVIRKSSVWMVMETSAGVQSDTDLTYFKTGLTGFLDSTTTAKVLQRVS